MANSVDPDQMLHSGAYDLGLHFSNTYLSQYLGLLRYIIIQKSRFEADLLKFLYIIHCFNLTNLKTNSADKKL